MTKPSIVMIKDPLADGSNPSDPVLVNALFQAADIFGATPPDRRVNLLLSILTGFLLNETEDPFRALNDLAQACHERVHAIRGQVPGSESWPMPPVNFTGETLSGFREMPVTVATWRGLLVIASADSAMEAAGILGAMVSAACIGHPDPADFWTRLKKNVDIAIASQSKAPRHG